MNIGIIDYDAGNIDSVKRAVQECGKKPFIAENASFLKNASHIILPGVGSFFEGMEKLKQKGFIEGIKEHVVKKKIPFLGICLGMQLLATKGTEGGKTNGLGLIDGQVILLKSTQNERIPHIGWNEVIFKKGSPISKNIESGVDFYFVHSYHLIPDNQEDILAVTPYCGEFVSAVSKGNIFGVQFHPEKSQTDGFQLLKNFLNMPYVKD
jgi:glutamine amidotransferase